MSTEFYKETPLGVTADFGPKASPINFTQDGINKVASLATHIPEKLVHVINEIEKNADAKYAYLYDRALGSGEIYGPNNNGDFFGRDELVRKHDTFVKCAHVFRHHQNKDPRNAIGSVMASAYNEPMDTVDLILRCPMDKVASDIKKFEDGGSIATSMGAKVAFDVCSICGNQARSRMHYCQHLKSHMLRVYPDGRQVYAKNPNPRFVDISMVVIPADPASTVLRKIASMNKISDMKKEDIGANVEDRGVLNPTIVDATNNLSRAEALSTISDAKGTLRPDEFQAILRKDASLIRPDIVPYVEFRVTEKIAMASGPIPQLARAIASIDNIPLQKNAKYQLADFLDEEEKYAYLQYRNSEKTFSRDFLR